MNMPLRAPLVKSWPVTEDGRPATLIAALARNAVESGNRAAFRERDRGVWQERSWAETFGEVIALAAALDIFIRTEPAPPGFGREVPGPPARKRQRPAP